MREVPTLMEDWRAKALATSPEFESEIEPRRTVSVPTHPEDIGNPSRRGGDDVRQAAQRLNNVWESLVQDFSISRRRLPCRRTSPRPLGSRPA